MKITRTSPVVPTHGRWWQVSLAAASLALSALLVPAPSSFAGVGFGGGDGDAVGSLPSSYIGGPGAGQHGIDEPSEEQFNLTLVGDLAQINSMVTTFTPGASGGYWIEQLGSPGLVRISFLGDVTLEFDRTQLESSFVAVQLQLGPVYKGGLISVQAGKKQSLTAAVPGVLPVHLQQLSWSQVLEQSAELRATTVQHKSRALGLSTAGDNHERIVLTQKN